MDIIDDPLTAPVILLGDTQEHEITGLPTPGINGGFFDRFLTDVTIRPPQQALFGRFLLREILETNADKPVIHLGDLLDLSCKSELNRYDRLLHRTPRQHENGWAIVPGNHDGLALGILNINDNREAWGFGAFGWDYGCRDPRVSSDLSYPGVSSAFLSRDQFLLWYADHKKTDQELEDLQPATNQAGVKWIELKAKHNLTLVNQIVGKVLARNATSEAPFSRSYLVQKIWLPESRTSKPRYRVSIIAFDTNQFAGSIDSSTAMIGFAGSNPGSYGHLQDDQIAVIRQLISNQADDEIILFAAHHNWDSIEHNSRRKLAKVLAQVKNPVVYLSAHTHEGFWHRWRVNGRAMLELNVNSLADWPIAYREFQILSSGDKTHLRLQARLAVPSVNGGVPVTEQIPEFRSSQPLLDAWAESCAGASQSKGTFAAELDRQFRIVRTHRLRRQQLANTLASLAPWPRNAFSSHLLYEDKLNDLVLAAHVLADLTDISLTRQTGRGVSASTALIDTLRQVKMQSIYGAGSVRPPLSYESRFQIAYDSGGKGKLLCTSEDSLYDCLGKMQEKENALAVIPKWGSPQRRYFEFSTLISGAQDALDSLADRNAQHQLVCIAAAAAIADAAEQRGLGTRYEDVPLEPTFYVEAADIAYDGEIRR